MRWQIIKILEIKKIDKEAVRKGSEVKAFNGRFISLIGKWHMSFPYP